ncbi:MAG TPA: TetR/AcrR family transcriptional regulator [Candidatus Acidoferrales bacterium]|nr:TetR/AcrR family transcriptional regulator [Candidatus Acidoferrales bacterium]
MAKLTPKGSATRNRIVAVAAKLIAKRGVAQTSIEDVCDAAAVSPSQLYHYFKNKLALVRAVIDYQTKAVMEIQANYLRRLDSIGALRRWRDHLVGLQRTGGCKGGCPLGTLSSELAEISPQARHDLASSFEVWEDGIRTGLRAMRDRGDLRGDPDELALATLAALQGGLLLTQSRRDPAPLEAALDAVIDHIASLSN